MFSVVTRIWNQIAKEQELQTPMAKRLFPLDVEEMEIALAKEESRLAKQNNSGFLVAGAYLTVAPLLWENQAIAAYKRDHPGLEAALPELVDVGEAVLVASKDFPLSEPQQKQLGKLLETLPE